MGEFDLKKELPHYNVDKYYGGSQSWMRTPMMFLGGCGALTACDSCIYFQKHGGIQGLYPFDINQITKKDYVRFGMRMKPYLPPRKSGIDKLELYINEFMIYLNDCGCNQIEMSPFSGYEDTEKAWETLKKQIDEGYPIPMLTLLHQDPALKDYRWHWYIINGYDDETGTVKAVTYGEGIWINFRNLWETGCEPKGGMVLYKINR